MLTWIKLPPINLESYSCIEKKVFKSSFFQYYTRFFTPQSALVCDMTYLTPLFSSVCMALNRNYFSISFDRGRQYLCFWYLFYPFLLYQEKLSCSDTYRKYEIGGLTTKICCEFVCMKYLLRLLEDLKIYEI